MRLKDFTEAAIIVLIIGAIVGLVAFGAWYEWRKLWFFISY